jgi:small conductance mechanosensitive channel
MLLSTPSPQLSDSLPQDERFFQVIERGWRADLAHFIQYGVPKLVFAFLLVFAFQSLVTFLVSRMRKRADALVGNAQRAAQLRTMASVLRATSYGIMGFYLLTQILGAIGVSLGPFVAAAGVIGLGISFGAQSIFKDVLTGVFILVEDQYSVGDTIKIASLTGTVEDLTLRVTNLRDGGDGTLYIVPNSQITTVSNLSRDFSAATVNIVVDVREDPDHVVKVLKDLAAQIRKDDAFKEVFIAEPDIPGVDTLTGYQATYSINIRVKVNQQWGVMREIRRRVMQTFTREKIAFAPLTSSLVLNSREGEQTAEQTTNAQTPGTTQSNPATSTNAPPHTATS